MAHDESGLSAEELAAEGITALPDKEVVSILDLNADIDLAIDAAAPIDLAVAANLNVAAPIDAAVGANVLSVGSIAGASSEQGVLLTQGIAADATADATQDSTLDQGDDTVDGGPTAGTTGSEGDLAGTTSLGDTVDGTTGVTDGLGGTVDETVDGVAGDTGTLTEGGALSGDLLAVDVNVDADTDLAAPVNGAVAANANVAAPINGSVAANIGSIDSVAVSDANQQAIIDQQITGTADATSNQTSDIQQ